MRKIERQRAIETETDGQRDIETETDRQRDIHRDREAEGQSGKETERQRNQTLDLKKKKRIIKYLINGLKVVYRYS